MQPETQLQPDQRSSSKNLRVMLWILIVCAGAEFIVRGPLRFLQIPGEWNDLSQNYAASKLWLKGLSPADPKNFVALWKQESGSHLDLTDVRTHLAPPLGGLVVMAPVAAFPIRIAKIIWIALLIISFVATVWAMMRTGGLRWGELRTLAFVAACLALAPFQTGLASGNTTVLVIGLCALAIWAATRGSDVTAGILFGVACSLKPQIGAFLVLYYLLRQRWRMFLTAIATTIGLIFVAALHLSVHGTSWIQDYLHNAKGFVNANPIDDFSAANPARFALINLQVPFFSITGQSLSANWLAFAVTALLLCIWSYWVIKARERCSELLCLSAVSVVALLPVYHRFYDAALLVVPLCWCVTTAVTTTVTTNNKRSKPLVNISLLLMTSFLFPGAAFLQGLVVNDRIPIAVTQSWWWNCIVMPHETWALLLLSMVLLFAMKRDLTAPLAAT
jgi:hypothetical protein